MASRVYNRTVPDNATTDSSTIGTTIQLKGQDLDERIVQGGHKMGNITHSAVAEETDGKHAVGVEDGAGNDTGAITIWDFAGTTPLLRIHGKDHASKPRQIWANPDGGGAGVPFLFIGQNITVGDDPGHRHTRSVLISNAALTAFGFNAPTVNPPTYIGASLRWSKAAGAGTQTVTRLDVRAGAAPGANIVWEFRKTSGPPADTANIYSDAVASLALGQVTHLAGQFAGNQTTITNATLADGEWITIKLVGVTGWGNLLEIAFSFTVIG